MEEKKTYPKTDAEGVRKSVLAMLRRLQSLPPEEIYNSLQTMIDGVEYPVTLQSLDSKVNNDE